MCRLGSTTSSKGKKVNKSCNGKKNRAMIETYQTIRNRGKGRWVIIHEKQRKEKEGNGIGLKQKNEKRDF